MKGLILIFVLLFRYIFRYRSRKALVGQELPMDGRLHPGKKSMLLFPR